MSKSDEFGFRGATFDSRLVQPGMLYIALKGSHADGNDFIPKALEAGAAKVIGGDNALEELHALARDYRRSLENTVVVALTGSAGKTTTKELLRAFLSSAGKTWATQGNYNNHLGLPVTILNCPSDARFMVLEMGSNHPGEIALLCDIACPDSGLVTNVGTAHMEFFGSQAGIAREKGTLLERVADFGVVGENCAEIAILRALSRTKLIEAPDIAGPLAEAVRRILPGEHNIANASVAYALASRYGVTEEMAIKSLEGFSLPGARWRRVSARGIDFIDDTYNANPDAMKAALKAFSAERSSGRKIAVLGDMFELGADSARLHGEVFAFAMSLGLDCVVAVGEQSSRCTATHSFRSLAEASESLGSMLESGDLVLLKASNAMKLGKIAEI